jgi:hypothetical protein
VQACAGGSIDIAGDSLTIISDMKKLAAILKKFAWSPKFARKLLI